MRLEVRVFAGLHRHIAGAVSGESFSLEIRDGCTGYELLQALNVPIKEVFTFMVNGRRRDLALSLAEGDRIGIFPSIGGG